MADPCPVRLKLMKRPGAIERTLERIHAWRAICPEITLRSTFIVGFPGETEGFRCCSTSLRRPRWIVSAVSVQPDRTREANELPDPVPESVQEERYPSDSWNCNASQAINTISEKVSRAMLGTGRRGR